MPTGEGEPPAGSPRTPLRFKRARGGGWAAVRGDAEAAAEAGAGAAGSGGSGGGGRGDDRGGGEPPSASGRPRRSTRARVSYADYTDLEVDGDGDRAGTRTRGSRRANVKATGAPGARSTRARGGVGAHASDEAPADTEAEFKAEANAATRTAPAAEQAGQAAAVTTTARRTRRAVASAMMASNAGAPGDAGASGEAGTGRGAGRSAGEASGAAGASAPTRGRRQALNIARSRAAHFANYGGGSDGSGGDDDPADGDLVDGGEQGAPHHWPGPWSTAMAIAADQEARKEAREEEIRMDARRAKFGGTEPPATHRWTPARTPADRARPRSCPRSLFDISMGLLVKHADCVVSLVGVPDSVRRRYAEALAERRKLSSEVFALLGGAHTGELVAPDCAQIEEAELREVLCALDADRLECLELQHCGRGLSDSVAATFASTYAAHGGLPLLHTVRLGGAYRMSDDGVASLLSAAPRLRTLALNAVCRLTGHGVDTICAGVGESLTSLDLSHSNQLKDADVRGGLIDGLPALERLNLAGLENLTAKLLMDIAVAKGTQLTSLDVSDCHAALTDAAVAKVCSSCTNLEFLSLDGGEKLTDKSVRAVASGCKRLQELSLARCRHMSAPAICRALGELTDLRKLSLNAIPAVDDATLQALGNVCGASLLSLDLSWCREFSEDALGLLTEACPRLRRLAVWGCRQITERFVNGHGLEELEVAGHHSFGLR